jgi:hypothetical protein
LICQETQIENQAELLLRGASRPEKSLTLINIKVNAPFNYELTVYSNLGNFVNKANGSLDQASLNRLKKDKDGNYHLGMLWWPVSETGQLVATGAYICRGSITTRGSQKTIQGSQGQYEKITNRSEKVLFLFGNLRNN